MPCPRGSPPRVRGKHRDPIKSSGRYRITPACAGKTVKLRDIGHAVEDHPRVCGENGESTSESDRLPGSPPRVRGKLFAPPETLRRFRITPACAGKTGCPGTAAPARQDHPRVCGENSRLRGVHTSRRGSPPRVRGKPSVVEWVIHKLRITPACAGKTEYMRTRVRFLKDHPRVCGENTCWGNRWHCTRGSPPRVRGKPSAGFFR